jgi:alpha-glucosidase
MTSDVDSRRIDLGQFTLAWETIDGGYRLAVERDGTVLWRTHPGENVLEAPDASFEAEHRQGPFEVTEHRSLSRADQRVAAIDVTETTATLTGTLSNDGREAVSYELNASVTDAGHLRFRASTDPPTGRLGVRAVADPGERFYGFGEQACHLDLDGREVPIITQEPGIGRDHLYTEFLVEAAAHGSSGSTVSSYAPMPYYLSSEGYSLTLENTSYSVFDLRPERETSVRCYTDELVWRLIGGETPMERVESHTAYTGRMPALPEWVHSGPIVGLQGGTERVREVWSELRDRDTPLAGFWLQDWVGTRTTSFGKQLWWNWELDRQQYPDWEDLVADLNEAGVDVLGYVSPYLVDVSEKETVRRNLFAEAREKGYLVTRDGEVFMLPITDFSAALVDLSNTEARAWLRDVISDAMFDNGFRGWMADFGEGLPFDAELADADAEAFHNQYVVEWAELNRTVTTAADREDAVFFTRSGFTRSPAHSTLFWTGDQMVTWDDYDGLQTSIRALQTGGLSGISQNHFDAGGYTSIVRGPIGSGRGRELLMRWLEASAFTAVFRTHEGNQPDENAQIYDDAGTYDQFARCAKIYAALAPYRSQVCAAAEQFGRPVVRPLVLHYPDDETARERHTQFLLGRDVLVAPVVDKHQRERRVYLPEDGWNHLFTEESYDAGWHTVDAPVGTPPAFYRTGTDAIEPVRANLRDVGVIE